MPKRKTSTAKPTKRRNAVHKARILPMKFEPGFLTTLDRRTEVARALRQRFEAIRADLGGDISGIKASLLERFCWLEASLVKIEATLAGSHDGKEVADLIGKWVQLCNSLLGIGRALGLEKQAKQMDLASYINSQGCDNGHSQSD